MASLKEEKGLILCVDTPRAAKQEGPREPSSVMEMSCILIWQWFRECMWWSSGNYLLKGANFTVCR